MRKSRCLGLVGGLGVGATLHYYEKLAKGCEKRGRELDVVITNAHTPRVFEYVEANDRDRLAEYLNGYIRRMKAAGAEVAAIPAVTPHCCLQELATASPLPIVSIFDPLIRELARRVARRVAIFGTRFVIASELFGAVKDVEFIRPKPEEVDLIHDMYVGLAATGKSSQEKHEKLTTLAKTLLRRESVDAILLAGTDLTLLFNESNTDFPHVDCAALHIEAILESLEGADTDPKKGKNSDAPKGS
jgi:aspartate racemase